MDNRWNDAAIKLAELTRAGDVKWSSNPAMAKLREDAVGSVFVGKYLDKLMCVYEYKYRRFTDVDEWEWETDVAIEFVTDGGALEWRWPAVAQRRSLLDAIRYAAANAGDFLKKLLG